MANECEADDADGLEDSWTYYCKSLTWIAFEFGRDVWAFDQDRCYDNEHADQGQTGCSREFMDVAVEGQGVRYAYSAEGYDKLSVGEQPENRNGRKLWKY